MDRELDDVRERLKGVADPVALLVGIFAHAPVGLQIYRADGRCILTNRAFRRIFGAEPPPEYNVLEDPQLAQGGVLELTRRAFAGESFTTPPTWYDPRQEPSARGAGRRCAVTCTGFPLRDGAGRVAHVALVFEDVTEELTSEGRFSLVFRALPMAALISRMADKRFVDVNAAWERLTGWPRAEQIGRTSVELGLWQDVRQRDEMFAELARRGVVRDFAARMKMRAGERREVLLSVDRIEIGGEDCVLLLAHDVTELRRLERELRQAQKMEAIGRLAGGVAHDFNNILTAIGGADSLILDQLPAGDPLRPFAEQIRRSTRRAAALTQQLLTFTRKQPLEPVVIDPNDAVRATADMLQRMIGADIELVVELGATGRVKADAGSLEQVIMNLAVNSRDAMPAGGTLMLRTTEAAGGHDGVPAGAWIVIAVADTGIGMDAPTRARLFEPFFTTKEQGKGTGLGLSTVYGIVTQCRGHLVVKSELGRGSEFQVFLPREQQTQPAAAPPSPDDVIPGGVETILLAEDDDAVREYVSLVLRRLGYQVLEAADGADALAVADRFHGPIDLLLSDVVMPRMDGVELARRLGQARSSLKVMHMSGYPGDARAGADDAPFLRKPFDRDVLARRVRRVLDTGE